MQAHEAGPRNFLKRMAARLAERGWSCRVPWRTSGAWPLQRDGRYVPVDESLCFSTVGMAASAEVTDATVAALGEQGIQVEQYYAELGHGQQELSVAPRPAVQAADTQILVRETLRGVAARSGLVASPPPSHGRTRPVTGRTSTSACGTATASGTCSMTMGRFGLSRTAEQFLAGVLTHVPGLLALTPPLRLTPISGCCLSIGARRSCAGVRTTGRPPCGCRRRSGGWSRPPPTWSSSRPMPPAIPTWPSAA